MSTIEVKVGQVWQDDDKRRGGRRIEIIEVGSEQATGLIVGTEKETKLGIARLVTRWSLKKDAPIEAVDGPELIEKAKPKHKTREAWLEAAVKELGKLFTKKDIELPAVRVSVGWPGGRGKKQGVIGQCFPSKAADDSVTQIFVSPVVSDELAAVVVMAHELIHAVDDCADGHKKNFVRIAKLIGFVPKWTVATTDTITDEFKEQLEAIVGKLGTYPHAAIRPTDRPKVQKTYMLKVACVVDDEFFVRMTQGKIEEFGTPLCPCHKKSMELED